MLLLVMQLPATVFAGPAGGLCKMDTARGAVPSNFGLEACVDGNAIWLRNQLSVPVRIQVTGASGPITTVSSDGSTAALVTRAHYPNPALLLPGDLTRFSIGSGAASVYLAGTDAGGFYAEALTLSAFLPLGAGVKVYDAIAGGIADLVNDNVNYSNCLTGANWVEQIGCNLTFESSVTFHVDKMIVMGLASGALGVVLDFLNWTDKIGKQVPSVGTIIHSERTLKQSAVVSSGTGTGGGGAGNGGGAGTTNPPPSKSSISNIHLIWQTIANDGCNNRPTADVQVVAYHYYTGPPVTIDIAVNAKVDRSRRHTLDPTGKVGDVSLGYDVYIAAGSGTVSVLANGTTIGSHFFSGVCGTDPYPG
jgi:hypothetical protein